MIECPECGPVEHQAIPEDEAHCDNPAHGLPWLGSRDRSGIASLRCPCECHKAESLSDGIIRVLGEFGYGILSQDDLDELNARPGIAYQRGWDEGRADLKHELAQANAAERCSCGLFGCSWLPKTISLPGEGPEES